VSQRHLAHKLDIALGVTNLLVRSMAKKGYVRATQIGWKRWVYLLTPAGFTRKVQLTFSYVDRFLNHYKRVRTLLREDLGMLTIHAESRIAIYGTTELAELVYLALRDLGTTEIDVFDKDGTNLHFLGMPVKRLESIVPADHTKVIVALSANLADRCQELQDIGVSQSQIVTLFHNSNHWASHTRKSKAS